MYYRRKIILSLLQILNKEVDKVTIQKLLFLLSRHQIEKSFHFVPYKYGCFSFQANADLGTLIKYGIIVDSGIGLKKVDDNNYLLELNEKDRIAVKYINDQFGDYTKDELIRLTYRNYPYYAINSTISSCVLTDEELIKVQKQKPIRNGTTLFTLGYEGLTLEEYLNKLILNDIKVLCDVRKNPFSMKYGFNKNQLMTACNGVGIEYLNIPEVGIDSDKRQELNTQADYDKLFKFYKSTVLKNEIIKQQYILELLSSKKRIALTCFEKNINQCHRKHLADSLAKIDSNSLKVMHI
jgi:uncharacterized protein (DUF488 family)